MTYKLVLLRHGQSAWNKTNQFTGWVDVPLTEQGEAEAKRGGELLKEKNVLPDIVFTSLLRRAINTANIALDAADRLWIPVQRDWRLNERHYGALQGKNKTEIRQEYGDEKFMLWRRSYATPPPEIDPNDQYAQNNDPRYAGDPVPEAECLADVVKRVEPYFKSDIEPELKAGKTVLIAAHGNSLRAIVKMAHEAGMLCLADEAHGTHFYFGNGLLFWYSSGDDANAYNGSERLPSIDPDVYVTSYGFDGTNYGGAAQTLGYGISGTWAVMARVKDISFMEDLSHVLRVVYYQGTNNKEMVRQGMISNPQDSQYSMMYLTTGDKAVEVNFDTEYKLYKNLSLFVELGYIRLDLDKDLWKGVGYEAKENNFKGTFSVGYKF